MLANDLIWMHAYRGGTADRLRPRTGVKKPYRSLPSAIFILSFAAAEEHVKEAALNAGIYKGDKRKNGTMHMGNEGFIKKGKRKQTWIWPPGSDPHREEKETSTTGKLSKGTSSISISDNATDGGIYSPTTERLTN
jgi:hypothetical protein